MNTLEHIEEGERNFPVFVQLTIMSLALLAIALLWGVFETRMIDGVSVWMKPAKFSLSFAVHFATLAMIVAAMSAVNQMKRSIAIAAGVMAIAFLGEMTYLIFQAAQAEHSHFNFSTPFHTIMYSTMGVGAVLLIAMPVLVAWTARCDLALGSATRAGIWWGALASCVLTLLTAGYLSNQAGHFVGVPTDPSRVLPLVGWSTEVGDLRPAHFLSLHALQVLPLIGLWFDRMGFTSKWIIPLTAAYALINFGVLWQALLGLPLISI